MVKTLRPDCVTMDVEMPVMNGYEALVEIMASCPTPVVMVSSRTRAGAETTVSCLAAGAVDFVPKPEKLPALEMRNYGEALREKVKAAGQVALGKIASALTPVAGVTALPGRGTTKAAFLAVGCSTGGPRALQSFIPALPPDIGVPVFVVQHMPAGFTRSLAERLNESSALTVLEAVDGHEAAAGQVLIAPGGRHMEVVNCNGRLVVSLNDDPPVHGVRPSVDVLFRSLACTGCSGAAVILTGMGSDGTEGAGLLAREGSIILAESKETALIYGMPRSAVVSGCVSIEAPLHVLPGHTVSALRGRD
jgi:two-component system chemotaxis response regulator CheB